MLTQQESNHLLITQELLRDQKRLTDDFYSDVNSPLPRINANRISNIPISSPSASKPLGYENIDSSPSPNGKRSNNRIEEEEPQSHGSKKNKP